MKNLENKLLKRYVGYVSQRDEYEKFKIYEILANSNVLTSYLIVFLSLISLTWDVMHQSISLGTVILVTVLLFNNDYTSNKFRKYNLQQREFSDETSLKQAQKLLRRKDFIFGLIEGTWFTVVTSFFTSSLDGRIDENMWIKFLVWIPLGLLGGFLTYQVEKDRLKLVKDDES